MMKRKLFLGGIFCLSAGALPTFAGQGFTCSDFLERPTAEQQRYLEGYTLGAAMEMKYFKNNLLNSHVSKALEEPADNSSAQLKFFRSISLRSLVYLDEKYTLVNIAVAYPKEFHEAVQKECKTHGTEMFDVLPSALRKMKETGKYPVWGM